MQRRAQPGEAHAQRRTESPLQEEAPVHRVFGRPAEGTTFLAHKKIPRLAAARRAARDAHQRAALRAAAKRQWLNRNSAEVSSAQTSSLHALPRSWWSARNWINFARS